MKVILRTDITNIGKQGEIKVVADGFLRNYLAPKNLAMEATESNLKVWERERVKLAKQRDEIISAARETAQKLETSQFSLSAKIGDNGKIFGSITPGSIAKVLEDNGFNINKRDILLSGNIKELGSYEINVRLHPEVVAKMKVSVLNEDDKDNRKDSAS